jgi:hypothetical protein
MLDLFRTILELAKSLFGLSDQLRAADHQRKKEIADLFDSISSCLATVSSEIRMGKIPHGRCGELMTYADELPGIIRAEVGNAKADELGKKLRSAYNVEGAALELKDVSDKEPYLQEIEEASGKFQALANMIRAR